MRKRKSDYDENRQSNKKGKHSSDNDKCQSRNKITSIAKIANGTTP